MSWMEDLISKVGLDAYTFRARVQPAALVILPLALCVVVFDPSGFLWGKIGWALVAWAGGTALLSQLGRDLGRKKEPKLFQSWGGKQTTVALRYRENSNLALLRHRREKIQLLFPSVQLPTTEEEFRDPVTSDNILETVVSQIRNLTRNRVNFPLVFEENCNYGFRRNLWGMKSVGIVICIGTALLVTVKLVLLPTALTIGSVASVLGVGFLSIGLLLLWILLIKPSWVRVTAEAYTERLLDSLDTLKE